MKTNTLFQVRFRPSVTPPKGFTKSAHYNVTAHNKESKSYLIGNTWLPAKDFIKIEVEDAPVFEKPPLRKIASLKLDEVIECANDEELKAVLEQAEKEGLFWITKKKPTEHTPPDSTPLWVCTLKDSSLAYFSKQPTEFTILPASKFVEVGTEAKPEPPAPELKPFPAGYVIPKGTRVVAIGNEIKYSKRAVEIGGQGTVVKPFDFSGADVIFDGKETNDGEGYYFNNRKLAPLDPRDHPEHPEFGKQKQEEPITQAQKDDCVKLEERIEELEALCELRQQDSDNFADDLTDCNELINRMKELAKSSLSVNNDMLNRAALRAIANGEI